MKVTQQLASVALAAALWLLSSLATASTAVQLADSNGELFGALDVGVNATLYNVLFFDESCSSLFAGCDDLTDFDFNNVVDATVASQALLDQVQLNTAVGIYDDAPAKTLNCRQADSCRVLTPFGFDAETGDVLAVSAGNDKIEIYDLVVPNVVIDRDFDPGDSTATSTLYAVWIQSALVVPLPASAPLFAVALCVLTAVRAQWLAQREVLMTEK